MACDLKSSGVVDPEELQAVLSVFGARRPLSSVKMLFQKIDTDHSGTLDYNEVRSAIEELTGPSAGLVSNGFGSLWDTMDSDGDGNITLEEFERWWEQVEDINGISKGSAIGWARQLRVKEVEAIIADTKRQYHASGTVNARAQAIRTSPRLARAIGTSNLERVNRRRIGFSMISRSTGRGSKRNGSKTPSPPPQSEQLQSGGMSCDFVNPAINQEASSDSGGELVAKNVAAKEREMRRINSTDQGSELLLSVQEYVYMMSAGIINEYIPGGDWHAGAVGMRNLRTAFDTADVDGSDEIDYEEFSAVISALHHTGATDHDVGYIWRKRPTKHHALPVLGVLCDSQRPRSFSWVFSGVMNPQLKLEISFADFVAGIGAVQADDRLAGTLDLAAPNPWELLSLVIDTPVSKAEERQLLRTYGASVRLGMVHTTASCTGRLIHRFLSSSLAAFSLPVHQPNFRSRTALVCMHVCRRR